MSYLDFFKTVGLGPGGGAGMFWSAVLEGTVSFIYQSSSYLYVAVSTLGANGDGYVFKFNKTTLALVAGKYYPNSSYLSVTERADGTVFVGGYFADDANHTHLYPAVIDFVSPPGFVVSPVGTTYISSSDIKTRTYLQPDGSNIRFAAGGITATGKRIKTLGLLVGGSNPSGLTDSVPTSRYHAETSNRGYSSMQNDGLRGYDGSKAAKAVPLATFLAMCDDPDYGVTAYSAYILELISGAIHLSFYLDSIGNGTETFQDGAILSTSYTFNSSRAYHHIYKNSSGLYLVLSGTADGLLIRLDTSYNVVFAKKISSPVGNIFLTFVWANADYIFVGANINNGFQRPSALRIPIAGPSNGTYGGIYQITDQSVTKSTKTNPAYASNSGASETPAASLATPTYAGVVNNSTSPSVVAI